MKMKNKNKVRTGTVIGLAIVETLKFIFKCIIACFIAKMIWGL